MPRDREPTPWVALIALATGLVYLGWRLTTGEGVAPALFWSLMAVEAYGWTRLALRSVVTWRLSPRAHPTAREVRAVDLVVTAYAEPVDVVRATLIGCREVRYPHSTWLVDDRHRPELQDLAREMGARYVTRTDPVNGRTGALNHVLQQLGGDFVLLLDADQVPLPDALHRTMGYFDDEAVAVVQTPLEYQNRDSVLHAEHDRHERSLANDVVNPGRDRLAGAVWEGSSAVLRRRALLEIGGIPTRGSTGELQATIRLQGSGWRTRYHHEVIAHGLAAHDLRTLLRERARWARGHLAICTSGDNPLWAPKLRFGQRVAHAELLSDYFASVMHLVGAVVVIVSLLTAKLPLDAEPLTFAAFFAGWTGIAALARQSLGRGRVRIGESALHSALTFQIHLVAVTRAALGIDRRFAASSGPRVDHGGVDVLRQLSLLAVLTLLLEGAIALRLLDSLIGVPLPGRLGGLDLVVTAGIAAMVLWFLLKVLGIFVSRRQYRASHRQQIDVAGLLNGQPAKILDANTTGVSVVTPLGISVGQQVRVGLRVARVDGSQHDLWLDAIVRSALPNQDGTRRRLGCQFLRVDPISRDLLIEYLTVSKPFAELRRPQSLGASAG